MTAQALLRSRSTFEVVLCMCVDVVAHNTFLYTACDYSFAV